MIDRVCFVWLVGFYSVSMLSSGASAWQTDVGAGEATSLALDSAGDVVIAGEQAPEDNRFTVLKLSGATGVPLWHQTLADNYGSSAHLVAVDRDDNVVAAGWMSTDGRWPYKAVVIKFRGSDGAESWRWYTDNSYGADVVPGYPGAIGVDADGNVLVGTATASTTGAVELVVTKLDGRYGRPLWEVRIPTTVRNTSQLRAIAVDAGGDVIAAGVIAKQVAPGTGVLCSSQDMTIVDCTFNFLVIKLQGSAGTERWRYEVAGSSTDPSQLTSFETIASTVTVDAAGNVVAAGTIGNAGTGADLFLVKLQGANGAEVWRQEVDGSGNDNDAATAVEVDSAGDVLAAGWTTRSGDSDAGRGVDLTVVKLAGVDGSEVWRHAVISGGDETVETLELGWMKNRITSLSVNAAGDVVAGGWASPNDWNHRAFIVSKLFGVDGNEVWRRQLQGGANGVAVDGAQNVVAAGFTNSSMLDQDGNLIPILTVVKLADENISGQRLRVRDVAGKPAARNLIVESKDAGLFASAPGSAADPTLVGATLTLANPTTGETATLNLPAANWRVVGNPRHPTGFEYLDQSLVSGACKRARVLNGKRNGTLTAQCQGAGIGFSLDEPAQGRLEVRLMIGDAAGPYAMSFGGTILRDTPTTARAGRTFAAGSGTGLFQAINAPAPSPVGHVPSARLIPLK